MRHERNSMLPRNTEGRWMVGRGGEGEGATQHKQAHTHTNTYTHIQMHYLVTGKREQNPITSEAPRRDCP